MAQRRRELPVLLREDVLPGVEELLVGRSDRAEVGLVAAGADQQLIREEQPRLAFPQPGLLRLLSLVAVAHQLLEGFVHRVGGEVVGVLALDHHQRQAVHEQHDVGDDEVLARSRRVDAELVDGEEVVPLRVLEVDQLDVRVLLAGDFVDIDLRPVQQLLHGLVRFHQAAGGLVENLVDAGRRVACRSATGWPWSVRLMARTTLPERCPSRMTSRKLVRKLFVGSVGTPGP